MHPDGPSTEGSSGDYPVITGTDYEPSESPKNEAVSDICLKLDTKSGIFAIVARPINALGCYPLPPFPPIPGKS